MADEPKQIPADKLTSDAIVLLNNALAQAGGEKKALSEDETKALTAAMKPALEHGLNLGKPAGVGIAQEEANALAAAINEALKTNPQGKELLVADKNGKSVTVRDYTTELMKEKITQEGIKDAAITKDLDRRLGGTGIVQNLKQVSDQQAAAIDGKHAATTQEEKVAADAVMVGKLKAYNATMEKLLSGIPEATRQTTLDSMKTSAAEIVTLNHTAMEARVAYAQQKAALDEQIKGRETKKPTETETATLKAAETAATEAEKNANEKFTTSRTTFKDNAQLFDKVVHAAIDNDRAKDGMDKYKAFLEAQQGTTLNKSLVTMISTDRLAEAGIETQTTKDMKAAAGQSGKSGGMNVVALGLGAAAAVGTAVAWAKSGKTEPGPDGKPEKKSGFSFSRVLAVAAGVVAVGFLASGVRGGSLVQGVKDMKGAAGLKDAMSAFSNTSFKSNFGRA